MLSKYVPSGGTGARILQLGGGTRELYYYPKDVVLVTNVGEKVNEGTELSVVSCGANHAQLCTIQLLQLPSLLALTQLTLQLIWQHAKAIMGQ